MKILDFYRISPPSAVKIAHDKVQKAYKRQRMQTFLAATFGYALYYVCRLSMGVMKQPIIDAGLLNATQLGIVGACLYWTYAVGKLVNGFLADSANIKRFMATGIIISVGMNFIMGVLGVGALNGTIANSVLFISFCVFWAINGFAQSMGAPASIVSLSRWFPLKSRGTYYGIFSASHNIGEGLSFIFVGSIVAAFGWKWGFFGAALAGLIGFILVLLCFHDNPDSKGLPPIEVLSGEKTQEEYDATFEAEAIAAKDAQAARRLETKRMQKAVIKNPGVWIL
ncbi:MAG: MFS transporter, partial [Bacteroidales bacterium]|nr:MFS transporter [Bacteroidales bacterium]